MVEMHQQRLLVLAHRLLGWRPGAEDVVQDVMLGAWQRRHALRLEHDEASLSRYLNVAVVNRCRSTLVRRVRRRLRWGRAAREDRVSEPIDSTGAEVRAALERLPEADRQVLVLHYLESWPIDVIATTLEISRAACDQRLTRARKRLAELLPPEGDE